MALGVGGITSCADEGARQLALDESYEEWRATWVEDVDGLLVLEGDIIMSSEEALRRYWERNHSAPSFRATVSFLDHSRDNRFSRFRQLNISYCIDDAFGGDKAKVVSSIRRMALKWEQAANLNFVYKSGFDDDCEGQSTSDVYMHVRPSSNPAFFGAAFFPENLTGGNPRELLISDVLFDESDAQFDGTVLHELGHIIGLRHEHIHDSCDLGSPGGPEVSELGETGQSFNARDLTLNDRASVMYHDACPLAEGENLILTRLDIIGVKNLYNDTRSFWRGNGQVGDHRTDYDGDGRADISFMSPDNGSTSDQHIWYGSTGPGFSKTSYLAAPTNNHARPLAGLFTGADNRTDVIYYHQAGVNGGDALWSGGTDQDGLDFETNLNVFNTYQPLLGDFVGDDGLTDIFWYRPGVNPDALWQGNTNGVFGDLSVNVNGYYQPLVADFNGDGRSDILWYNPESNTSPVWYATSGSTFGSQTTVQTGGGSSGLDWASRTSPLWASLTAMAGRTSFGTGRVRHPTPSGWLMRRPQAGLFSQHPSPDHTSRLQETSTLTGALIFFGMGRAEAVTRYGWPQDRPLCRYLSV